MPVNLCYTQKVRGFQQEKVKYSSKHKKPPENIPAAENCLIEQ